MAYIVELDYVGGTVPIYVGYAVPGAATNEPAWRIAKITYDGNNNPLTVLYANGDDHFKNVWDNRGTFTYT